MENNQLLDWLRKMFGLRSAVEIRRENPVLVDAITASAEIFEQTALGKLLDYATCDAIGRKIYLETNAVCNAGNPVAACREKLTATMLHYAMYQVLLIPARPAKDESGLRGLPGISGELSAHVEKLSRTNMMLMSDLHESEYFNEIEDIRKLVEVECWKSFWILETLNQARIGLGDFQEKDDWYFPFKHAACAAQENLYRIDLDLPPAFADSVARRAPTAYSIFTDIVISGASDPLTEWCDYHLGQHLPTPGTILDTPVRPELVVSNSH
jgi:hypothetical protein